MEMEVCERARRGHEQVLQPSADPGRMGPSGMGNW